MLEKHLSEGSSNAQYTLRFSARVLIEAIDIWIGKALMCSLQESSYFSIIVDESQDISTQEELSICGRWLVNGKPEEHFLTVLDVHSTDAGTIAEALQSLQQKQLDLMKLFGQGYGGAATFAGKISGVANSDLLCSFNPHPLFFYRLQLASILATASVKEIHIFFNHDQRLEVVLLFPPKSRDIKGYPGCSWFF